jgi:hypothetical protein
MVQVVKKKFIQLQQFADGCESPEGIGRSFRRNPWRVILTRFPDGWGKLRADAGLWH